MKRILFVAVLCSIFGAIGTVSLQAEFQPPYTSPNLTQVAEFQPPYLISYPQV